MRKVVRRRVREDNTGLFVFAGIFLGLGWGALTEDWLIGILFGLGFGFFAMAIAKILLY